ncbi:MAG: phage head-tail adapter protein [Ruminococcus sp.]|nr:phage head-tail adapter protein [Ruminococcus sp.]
MNKEWSEQNKTMQSLLRKADTFAEGVSVLIDLRDRLLHEIMSFKNLLSEDDFSDMPFPNANGYHSKTAAYSLWHIFRIEDIVAHTLVIGDEQVFFSGDYKERTRSPIITTGNELEGQQIAEFSRQLDIRELYKYINEVKSSTDNILCSLTFEISKRKIPPERREKLCELNVVSSAESAVWLIDYWCSKDIRGLIRMPFSRHWIMHVEACKRICDKIIDLRNKRGANI